MSIKYAKGREDFGSSGFHFARVLSLSLSLKSVRARGEICLLSIENHIVSSVESRSSVLPLAHRLLSPH